MTALVERMRGGAIGVPAFRRLWVAGLVSDAGDWLLLVALPLVVLQLSGSAFGTAFAFLLELVPAAMAAPVAARLVGRVRPQVLLASINALQALALVPLLFVHEAAQLPLLYAVIAVEAFFAALYDPAKNAVLPDLVDPTRLVSANGLIGVGQNVARLVGGPLGGVVLAWGGLPAVAVADLATYLVTGLLVLTLRMPAIPSAEADGADIAATGGPAGSGVAGSAGRAILDRRFRGLLATTFVGFIAQGMFLVLFVFFVTDSLHGGEPEVGLLRGVQAIGAIAAGLAIGLFARAGTRALMAGSTAVFGAIALTMWNLPLLTTGILPYVLLFVAVGAPGVIMGTAEVTTLQRLAAPAERGAVFAAFGLAMGVGQGVGLLAAGLLQPVLGTTPLLEVQGAVYLLTALLALILWPRTSPPPPRTR